MSFIASIVLFLVMVGAPFTVVTDANITVYAPELLDPLNCMEPCDLTAFLAPVVYGVTVACGPELPFNTAVFIEGVGWRRCQDRGGAIDNDEVDIAIALESCFMVDGFCAHWFSALRDVLWVGWEE